MVHTIDSDTYLEKYAEIAAAQPLLRIIHV